MEVYVYDRNLYRKGIIEDCTSLQWHRKYYECGTFELHAPVTDRNLRLLRTGNVITVGSKREAAVIRGDQAEEESTDTNEMVRNGYFLPVYLGDRLTGPLFNYTGTVEDGVRYMISRAAGIPLLRVADGTGDTTRISFQATYKNLLSYVEKLARYAEMGFRVVPDFKRKEMVFETYKGVDRTQAQGVNPRVVFSEDYQNLNRIRHNYSDESYISKVVVGGSGEGSDRVYVTVGEASGFGLREAFLDARDISRDELSDEQYDAALRARGEDFLVGHGIYENFEAEVAADVNFIYGKDYDLGDIVTVRKKGWGENLNLRITEVCEVYEHGGMYIVPTFGDILPTAIDWDD